MAVVDPRDIALFRGEEDWSALYVGGKLEEVGDHYWVQEKLLELIGIDEIVSDDFLLGGNAREDVARTVHEIHEYRRAQDALAADEAAKAALLAEADELEARARSLREAASGAGEV